MNGQVGLVGDIQEGWKNIMEQFQLNIESVFTDER